MRRAHVSGCQLRAIWQSLTAWAVRSQEIVYRERPRWSIFEHRLDPPLGIAEKSAHSPGDFESRIALVPPLFDERVSVYLERHVFVFHRIEINQQNVLPFGESFRKQVGLWLLCGI